MIKSIRCFLICIAGLLGGIATAQVGPPWPQTITSQPPPPPAQQIAMDPIFGPLCAGPFGPGLCLEVNRFLQVQYARNQIQVPFLGIDSTAGPICMGPMGPGPCEQVRTFIAVRSVAMTQVQAPIWGTGGMCIGPLGPGPCDAVKAYLMQTSSGFNGGAHPTNIRQPKLLAQLGPNNEAMCMGPSGGMPCALLSQVGLDTWSGQPSAAAISGLTDAKRIAQRCAKQVGVDVNAFAACAGQRVVLPQKQQEVLDCAVNSNTSAAFAECAAPKFGVTLPADQRQLAGCAVKARGEEQDFRSCVGSALLTKTLSTDERAILNCATSNTDAIAFGRCAAGRFMGRSEKAVVDCAIKASDATSFAACAVPFANVKMSDDQRLVAKCAMQAKGETSAFASCAGGALLGNKLGPNEQKVMGCAAASNGDQANFAVCSANSLFGDKLSKEQQIAVQCAAQSQGDPTGFAACAGANLFGMQLNPEQQIAVQCLVGTGGAPPAAAGCMASRLTARELSKCLTNGVGGEEGCFGDNNDLVGKNGFVGRTFGQIAGGSNSLLRNPNRIWGGDNSFVRNPGQIWGGPNSFVRNPAQIWGGSNSVFNNPGQLLPQPKPVQVGTIAGKRICLPWC